MADEGMYRGPAPREERKGASGMLVVAVDFGTTYSGYAYSFRSDFDKNPLQIFSQNFVSGNTDVGGGSSKQTEKVPTTILFNPDKEFDSFGFEAEDKYAKLCKDNTREARSWYYFERFKMNLHKSASLDRGMILMDFTHKKSMTALEVFSASIRYLKDHVTQTLVSRRCPVKDGDISWVLTVPAIWGDQARQFMREAAEKAGIPNSQLELALEPESASVFCQHYFPSLNTSSTSVDLQSEGQKFLVVDCGGGTIDLTVYEVMAGCRLKELYRPTGGAWGGTKVDEAFKVLLYDVAGFDAITSFNRLEMLQLYREFEQVKRTPAFADKVPLKMPESVREAMATNWGSTGKYENKVALVRNRLMIDREVVETLFSDPCNAIVSDIENVLNQEVTAGLNTILLVGGFSESTLVQQAVRQAYPHHKVLVPDNPAAAVLKGAVIYRHRPEVIGWRASAFTYGVKTTMPFEERDPLDKLEIVDEERKCKDRFSKFISINEIVEAHQEFPFKVFHPLHSGQKAAVFDIFTSPDEDPRYTTDPGCQKIGSLTVQMPDLTGDKKRKIHVTMIVGGIELKVLARDENTNREFTTVCDFLCST